MARLAARALPLVVLAIGSAIRAGPVEKARRARPSVLRPGTPEGPKVSIPAPTPALGPSPLLGIREPLSLATLSRILDELDYRAHRVDEVAGWLRLRIRGPAGISVVYLVPDGVLLHFLVPRVLEVAASSPQLPSVLQDLMEKNAINRLGRYGWDRSDGEVRFGYSLVASEGVSAGDLAIALSAVVHTLHRDLPEIRRIADDAGAGVGPKLGATGTKP